MIGYADLRSRLARKLGSQDLAAEALHETWIRLGNVSSTEEVRNPAGYLFRAALNTGINLKKSEAVRRRHTEIAEILEQADTNPSPDRIAADREELQIVLSALAELPERQQTVFRETFTNGTSQTELAARFGVTSRTVQSDLSQAVKHCEARLDEKGISHLPPPKLSR